MCGQVLIVYATLCKQSNIIPIPPAIRGRAETFCAKGRRRIR